MYEHLQTQFEQQKPDSGDEQTEPVRDRLTQRTMSVLAAGQALDEAWAAVQSFIRVERTGLRATKAVHETMFYISSLTADAHQFAERIRHHWQIENRLHWVRDVVLKQDTAPLCSGYAPENMAILRTMAINLLRLNGFASITKASEPSHLISTACFLFSIN